MSNAAPFIDSAKVMAKGQVTIPADVRKALGVSEGDRVSFVVDGDDVRIVNAAVFAMKMLQKGLAGQASKLCLENEEDVNALMKQIRSEGSGNESAD